MKLLALALVGAIGAGLGHARAADYLDPAVVKPIMPCSNLANVDLTHAADGAVTIKSATVLSTAKGDYCKVQGTVAPLVAFETDLPIDHWTQRFAESAMGRGTIANAGGCSPAINGELVVAAAHTDLPSNGQTDAAWTSNLEARINYAYRNNHEAALVSKALIKAFYRQPAKYSYFVGCSEGGRESLEEAQRYPDDFDGIAAGAPVAIDSVHNAFYHPWESHVNRRADGSRILAADRLPILHKAVIAHCAGAAGLLDGMLQQPTACSFNPSWVQCAPGSADTSQCLTAEETAVVAKLYAGPSDDHGDSFEISGFPLGSEMQWKLSTAKQFGDRETNEGFALRRLLPPPEGNEEGSTLAGEFRYNQDWYRKLLWAAPLYNAANTDLRPFEQHGGRLILWIGAEDTTVQPAVAVAYYEGVRAALGTSVTDQFLRFFLLPGVGHCGGGEGASQIDVLTPLMAWTELHRAPRMLVTGKLKVLTRPGAMSKPPQPYSLANQDTSYTRPVFPFPLIAAFNGEGDRGQASNYHSERRRVPVPQQFSSQAAKLIGPDNQKSYAVVGNTLKGE